MEFLKNESRAPNPRKSSNFLSRFFFRYLNSTFAHGFKRPLNKADVFKIDDQDSCEILSNQLRKKWHEEINQCHQGDKKPSLFKAILKMTACRMFLITFLMLLLGLLKILQAFLLQMLLKEIAKPNFWERSDVYYWACGLSGAIIVTWIFLHHSVLASDILGVNMKNAVLGLLFKKTLNVGETSLNGITSGHVITLFSTDAQKIQEMFRLVSFIAIAPVLLIVSTYLLWRELGPSCLAGIGVMLVLMPLQAVVGRFFGYVRVKTVEKTNKRMNLMNEIISSMQITKMFTWEESFANLVKSIRREESNKIMSVQLMRAFNNAMYGCSPYIVGLATFVTFYMYGTSNLTVSLVAGTMSLFFAIRMEVTYFFPLAIQGLFEGTASCRRIQKYLLLHEVESLNDGCWSCTKRTPSLSFDNVFAIWTKGEVEPAVKGVSFSANLKNNLVMVVGPVGSGKTTLLKTILSELIVQKGKIQRTGTLAYSAQQPWIFSGTIRQNILFGKQFKKSFYEKVVTACALAPDFGEFEKGDLTMVGERGVLLSCGQKARISLARALYSDADIYLLDDPLNSVDAKVGRHIFERCIQGFLKKKITILVTHQIQYLEHATRIICLQKDSQSEEGTFEQLTNRGINLLSLLRPEPDEKFSDVDSAIDTDDDLQYRHTEEITSTLDLTGISLNVNKNLTAAEARSSNRSLHSSIYDEENNNTETDEETAEKIARGAIPAKMYLRYIVDGIGWILAIFLLIGLMAGQVMMTLADVWLTEWALGEEQRSTKQQITSKFYSIRHLDRNMYAFIILVCLALVGNLVRLMVFFAAMVKCSRRLHDQMFEAVLNAPIYFFETNPIGQILNRFSKDIYLLDEELPCTFNDMVQLFFLTLAIIVLNCISVPYLLIVLAPIVIVFLMLRFYFLRSSRQLRRLEAVARSPFYTHLACTLEGLSTIRSFQLNRKILNEFYACADHQVEGWLMYTYAKQWFGLRLDIIASVFSICAIFAPLVLARFIVINEVLVGVSLTYVLLLSGMFNWCVHQSTEVDNLMTSVERVYEYVNLEPELDDGVNKELREGWPEYGLLTCESVSFSYHSSLPYVLRRLFFVVRPYEKIGIVGRTGSGKSSIINMLFRMGNTNGTVRIDGYPIHQLKLKNLRQAISIIPQNPVLFSGSIRKNLDPFSKFLDGDIWETLEEVQMNEKVMNYKLKLDTEITESGLNLSIGERQLLCLAKALLQKNKVLLIDEATANVDFETDTLIQRTIRDKFKECTVITIAHRLNTIMDSDRVMVLEGGKMVEFDEPSALLENSDGYFRKLVDQAGRNEANRLETLAEESKHLRHLMLLQTQLTHPGSHITVSKTKAELISYFGTQVVYETNV